MPLSLPSLRFILEVLANAVEQEKEILNRYGKGEEKIIIWNIIILLENPRKQLKIYWN